MDQHDWLGTSGETVNTATRCRPAASGVGRLVEASVNGGACPNGDVLQSRKLAAGVIMKPPVAVVAIAAVVLVAVGCGGGEEAGGTFILAEQGGTVTSEDGKLTLEIPAGALSGDITAVVTSVAADEPPQELRELAQGGPAYRLEPDGLELSLPITVSLRLAEEDLSPDHPEDGTLAYLLLTQAADGQPELLDELETEASLDDGSVVVRGKLSHFSWLVRRKSFLEVKLEQEELREKEVGDFWAATTNAKKHGTAFRRHHD